MGNSSSKSIKIYKQNKFQQYYNTFIQFYCIKGHREYMNYYEFCYAFGIYLREECNIKYELYSLTGRTGDRLLEEDYLIFAINYVDFLCNNKKLIRIGFRNSNPILYGIKLIKFPKIQI
jgi:hypothetical protein